MGRGRERERAGVKFFHNTGVLQYTDTIYIVYMHYDALVCTHMAMRSEWKRGSHTLSYRRAGPCEMPSLRSCPNLRSLTRCLGKVFTCWRERGAEMFSHLRLPCSALSLLAYSFKLALCIAHTRPLPRKKKRERAAVCVLFPPPHYRGAFVISYVCSCAWHCVTTVNI